MSDAQTPAPGQPVTPAPAAPAAPLNPEMVSARDFFNQDDDALAESLGVTKESTGTERPAAPEAPPAPRETIPTDSEGWEGEAAQQLSDAVNEPGAELKVLDRKPMTEFVVLDGEGELEIPDITIRFKAKGEDRELPLDHVVRLAQFGFANEEREQQVLAARRFVTEAQVKEQTLQQQISSYEQHYDRLFNDPAFYETARMEYLQQHTPEARAQRAESEVQRLKQQHVAQRTDEQIATFVQQTLVPSVQALLTNNPNVNEHEVLGRYTELTAPLLVNGRVPLNRLPHVQRLVTEDLASWVERQHYERELAKQQATKVQTRQTQETATAKRQAARVLAHQGSPAGNEPAKPTTYNSAKDWLSSTFGSND